MAIQIIADSGSTKTDWCLVEGIHVVAQVSTSGINPITNSREQCAEVVERELLPQLKTIVATEGDSVASIEALHFYGAGCIGAYAESMKQVLKSCFPQADVEVNTDLLGAARALFGHDKGIACILGTGANTGLYDGRQIADNIPPMGYILGDEGGGAALGKLFLNALYKRRLPASLLAAFEQEMHLTLADIIDHVYRRPMANRFLASLSPFIACHIGMPELQALVRENFRAFFRHSIRPYLMDSPEVGVVGSIASVYKDLLCEVAMEENVAIRKILPKPMPGLTAYHCSR